MSSSEKTVYTVSRLNQDAHSLLQQTFGTLQVEGEISNFTRPASGHLYLSLKDSRSQLRCAMFKGRNRLLDFTPENGQQVVVRGKLSIYQARGDYQLLADHMELAGRGALHRQFLESVERLRAEGWFDAERKRPLPPYPGVIAVVTSPTGAAIRDVLTVLERRYPAARIIIYPTQVQGKNAAAQIVAAIARANHHGVADALLLTRGGGSLEDLWSFNEEIVATAILQSDIPVVCGIGHEVDVTIADLVADLRAPTPSAAAELLVPDRVEEHLHLQQLAYSLLQAFRQQNKIRIAKWQQIHTRLLAQHPRRVITDRQQRIDELEQRLQRAIQQELQRHQLQLQQHQARLLQQTPQHAIERLKAKISHSHLQLSSTTKKRVAEAESRWQSLTRALDAVSPLATLGRGYSIIRDQHQRVITNSGEVRAGDELQAVLAKGTLTCNVIRTIKHTESY